MTKHVTPAPYQNFRALFIEYYNQQGEVCPFCQKVRNAFLSYNMGVSSRKMIPLVYLDGNDPRVTVGYRIGSKLGYGGLPTPMLVADGNVFVGVADAMSYKGLLDQISKERILEYWRLRK